MSTLSTHNVGLTAERRFLPMSEARGFRAERELMKIKSLVSEIMEKQKVTIRQLEDGAGISPQTIMRARKDGEENIEACSLRTLSKIAYYLDVSIKDLFKEI
jgi:DNA-binding Xre family transcriptional regulator